MKLNHLIHKIIFDIEFATTANHAAFAQDLELDQDQLTRLIDEELGEIKADIRLDQLILTLPDAGFTNYREVKEFIRQSLRVAIEKNHPLPAQLEDSDLLKYQIKTGLLPWWIDRELGLSKSLKPFKSWSKTELQTFTKELLQSQNHFKRFKNIVPDRVYDEFIAASLVSDNRSLYRSFLNEIKALRWVTSSQKVTAEYLALKNLSAAVQEYDSLDINLLSDLPRLVKQPLEKLMREHTKRQSGATNNDNNIVLNLNSLQIYSDPVALFINYLIDNETSERFNLTFLEFQLSELTQESMEKLVQRVVDQKIVHNTHAIHRLLTLNQPFTDDLLQRVIMVIHGKEATKLYSFFTTHNRYLTSSKQFAGFLKDWVQAKKMQHREQVYDFILEKYLTPNSKSSFLSGISESGTSSEVYLDFKNHVLKTSLTTQVNDKSWVTDTPISQGLANQLTHGTYLKKLLERFGYLTANRLELISDLKPWSTKRIGTFSQCLSKLKLNKNQRLRIHQQLWQDIIEKKNLTQRDLSIKDEIRNLLLQSAVILSDKNKAQKIIHEVIRYEINHSKPTPIKKLLSDQQALINRIDDRLFKEVISVLNPNKKLEIVHDLLQDVIIKSGQVYLLAVVRDHSVSLLSSSITFTAQQYAEELVEKLLKTQPSFKPAIIATLFSESINHQTLAAQLNTKALAALITLSQPERNELIQNWVKTEELTRTANKLEPSSQAATKTEEHKRIANKLEPSSQAAIKTEEHSRIENKLEPKSLAATKTEDQTTAENKPEPNSQATIKTEEHKRTANKPEPNSQSATKTEEHTRIENKLEPNSQATKKTEEHKRTANKLEPNSQSATKNEEHTRIENKSEPKPQESKDSYQKGTDINNPSLLDQDVQQVWKAFNTTEKNTTKNEWIVNASRVINKVKTVLEDHIEKKQLHILLNFIKTKASKKDLKNLIEHLIYKEKKPEANRADSKIILDEFKTQVPGIDFSDLQLKIRNSESAMADLRLLLEEILKEDRELVLNEQDLSLTDRFEYLIQRLGPSAYKPTETVQITDPITTSDIESIAVHFPAISYAVHELTEATNTMLENTIESINLQFTVKLTESWKSWFTGDAFAESAINKELLAFKTNELLEHAQPLVDQEIRELIDFLDTKKENTAELEQQLKSLINLKAKNYINDSIQQTSAKIDEFVHKKITAVIIETDDPLMNVEEEEKEVAKILKPDQWNELRNFDLKSIQNLVTSAQIDKKNIERLVHKLNEFLDQIELSINQLFKSLLSKKLTFVLDPSAEAVIEINEIFESIHSKISESDIKSLFKDLIILKPQKLRNKLVTEILELMNLKKQQIVAGQRFLLASTFNYHLNKGQDETDFYSGTAAMEHNQDFQKEIQALELEKEFGATPSILVKNSIRKLILEKRNIINPALKKWQRLQWEQFLTTRTDSIQESFYNNLKLQITPEEKALLPVKDEKKLKKFTRSLNKLLEKEREYVRQTQTQFLGSQLTLIASQTRIDKPNSADLPLIEEVLANRKSLISFVNNYESDAGVMTLLGKLSLESAYNKKTQQLLDQYVRSISQIEKITIDLNRKIGLTTMSDQVLKQFVRVELLKLINLPSANLKNISYSIIEKLSALHVLQPILEKLTRIKESSTVEKEVITALKMQSTEDEFTFIDRKIENEFYFNDLFYHILEHDEPPFWAKSKTYDTRDALKYFDLKIAQNHSNDVSNWLENKTIRAKITAHYLKENLDAQIRWLEAIETDTTARTLSHLFKAIILKSADLQINTNQILQQLIKMDVYKTKNELHIYEKFLDLASDKDSGVRDVLTQHFINLQVPVAIRVSLSENEALNVPVLVGYFMMKNTLPRKHQAHKDQILKRIKSALKNNPALITEILKNELVDASQGSQLLKLMGKKQLLTSIATAQKNLNPEQRILTGSVIKEMQSTNVSSSKFLALLNVIAYLLRIPARLQRSHFNKFYRLIQQIDSTTWLKIQRSILRLIQKEAKTAIEKPRQRELNSLENLIRLQSAEKSDPWKSIVEHYMHYGSLPKSATAVSTSELLDQLKKLLKTEKLTWKTKMHQWSRRTSKINHLLSLYPEDQKGALFTIIHPQLKQDISKVIDVVQKLEKNGISFKHPLKTIDDILLEIMTIWSTHLVYLTRTDALIISFIDRNLKITARKSDQLAALIAERIKKSTGNESLILKKIQTLVDQEISLKKKQEQQHSQEQATESKEGISIQNAGLILAWPFLATLFSKVGLLEKNKFIDDHSQQKAVLLTQYLINFSTDFEENELALNKLLCGLEINDFVDTSIVLNDYEKETATFLLKGITQNWEKLSNTSPTSLQETFLQREGVLVRHEKDYKLHVSSKAYDLLLQTIPWNIGMIQTTFMKNRILVEWNY